MGRIPENPYMLAIKHFPSRLEQAKKRYELLELGGKDLDWDDFAGMAHLSRSVMSEVKLGKRPPRLAEIVVFSTLLKCRPEWLAFASGEMVEPVGSHARTELVDYGITTRTGKRRPKEA
jgi:hypothetical protein